MTARHRCLQLGPHQFGARPHSSTVQRRPRTHTRHFYSPHKGRLLRLLTVRYPRVLQQHQLRKAGPTFPNLRDCRKCRWLTSFLAGRVVQPRFNRFTSDPIRHHSGRTTRLPILSSASTHSHYYSKPTELGISNVRRGEPGSTEGVSFIVNLETMKAEELLGLTHVTPLKDVVAESVEDFKARGYPGFTA
jgi:hypothetical protein